MSALVAESNHVDTTPTLSDALYRIRYVLMREAGQRVHCWFEYLVGALMSTASIEDVQALNPFLTTAKCQSLLEGVVVVLLTTMRLGQASLCLSELDSVIDIIQSLARSRTVAAWNAVPGHASLVVTQGMLQRALVAAKYDASAAVAQLTLLAGQVKQLQVCVDGWVGGRVWPCLWLGGAVCGAPHTRTRTRATRQSLPSISGSDAVSTAGFVFQLAKYDPEDAARRLETPQEFVAVLDKARRGCYHNGTRLPDPSSIAAGPLPVDATSSAALVHMLEHTSTHLADLLAAARHFIVADTSAGPAASGSKLCYDPRFLVFEFLFGYLLRRRQVEIVTQFMDSHRGKQSCVRQVRRRGRTMG